MEDAKSFQKLYEFVNVRTYSEAICETIRSMMSIAVSNGRNIQPFNLDKEIFIKFNLPLLHKIGNFINKVAKDWKSRGDKKFFSAKRSDLKLTHLSSSLANLRQKEYESSHFPVDLWDQN